MSTTHPPPGHPDETVGEILDGVVLSVAEDDEILISVPWMFKGYYNKKHDQVYLNQAFRSGDLGSFTPDGMLKITGHKKYLSFGAE